MGPITLFRDEPTFEGHALDGDGDRRGGVFLLSDALTKEEIEALDKLTAKLDAFSVKNVQ